jgi:hypothetical protein
MTIYLTLVKKFILELITQARDDSTVSDLSVTNQIMSFFNKGRNKELSTLKKKELQNLFHEIKGMDSATHENDGQTKKALHDLIVNCKEKLRLLCTDYGYDEGNTGSALTKILNYVTVINTELKRMDLSDMNCDDSLISAMRYQLALYPINVYHKNLNHPSFPDRFAAILEALGKIDDAIPETTVTKKPKKPVRNTRATRGRKKVAVKSEDSDVEIEQKETTPELDVEDLKEILKALKFKNEHIDKQLKVDSNSLPLSKELDELLSQLPVELSLYEESVNNLT